MLSGAYYPAERVDYCRHAAGCCARHRQTFLDRAVTGHGEMLIGSGAVAEPRIVGHVDDPTWTFIAARNHSRKNRFVTDEHNRRWRFGHDQAGWRRALREACADALQRRDVEPADE